jgi:crossover junction endonuclease MUS81
MKEELAKQGVTPVMRSLEVGDAQWIAKCHDPALLSRSGAEGDEVVLDWIVERKRMDDLIGSIKDGRFHEQKFRLNRSGVKKVIYIIEDMSIDPQLWTRYEEAVHSAIASTQVVNGYFVKRTIKMDDTIKYLARMTAMLKRTYERKPLNVIPTNVLTAQNYLPLLKHLREKEPLTGYYISYPAFASMSSKSEMMTLRDVFLKMLMTTRGVTGERAIEIQKRWKTPHEFVKAFEACGDGESGRKRKRELVASKMGHLVGRKKIAKAVSTRIAEIWGDA